MKTMTILEALAEIRDELYGFKPAMYGFNLSAYDSLASDYYKDHLNTNYPRVSCVHSRLCTLSKMHGFEVSDSDLRNMENLFGTGSEWDIVRSTGMSQLVHRYTGVNARDVTAFEAATAIDNYLNTGKASYTDVLTPVAVAA